MFLYAMRLGNFGQVKIGYTNDLRRRSLEHGRRFGCPKQVEVLGALEFTSKATVERLEHDLLNAIERAGYPMVIDPQGGKTERFIMENLGETYIELKVRTKTYQMRIW